MLLNLIFSRIAVEERRRWRNNREVNKSIDREVNKSTNFNQKMATGDVIKGISNIWFFS